MKKTTTTWPEECQAFATNKSLPLTAMYGDLTFRDMGGIEDIAATKQHIITISDAQTLRVWDKETGLSTQQHTRASRSLTCLALSTDGQLALWGTHGESVLVIDLSKQKLVKTLLVKDVRAVAISPDKKTALIGGDKKVYHFDLTTGKELKPLKSHRSQVDSVAFMPDGLRGISAGGDGVIKIHDLKIATATPLDKEKRYAKPLRVSPDGTKLAYLQWGTLHLWDLVQNKHQAENSAIQARDFCFSEDGGFIYCAGESLAIVETKKLAIKKQWKQYQELEAIALLPGTQEVALVKKTVFSKQPTFILVDLQTGETTKKAKGHTAPVTGLSLIEDKVLSVGADGVNVERVGSGLVGDNQNFFASITLRKRFEWNQKGCSGNG